jgi:hypothetical protein
VDRLPIRNYSNNNNIITITTITSITLVRCAEVDLIFLPDRWLQWLRQLPEVIPDTEVIPQRK